MADGAMVQLGVRGPQDCMVLAVNDTTYFKASYPRHTNFAMAELQIPWENTCRYGGKHITAKLPRSGDLLSQVYKYDVIAPINYDGTIGSYDLTTSPISAAWYTDSLANAMVERCEIQIGNHPFDHQTGEFMEWMSSTSDPAERLLGAQIGKFNSITERIFASQNTQRLYNPFKFWFCRFYEQALPMIGLYWHDVNLVMDQRSLDQLYHVSGGAVGHIVLTDQPIESYLIGNYVYLDKSERAMFASGKHEYIFDQTQYLGEETHVAANTTQNFNIRYNHLVSEIMWVCQNDAWITGGPTAGNNWFKYNGIPFNEAAASMHGAAVYVNHDTDAFEGGMVLLNNHERTMWHSAAYYRLVQPWERHTRNLAANRWIYMYCFGLRPEHMLDTGSANMSRMDTAVLRLRFPTSPALAWTGRVRIHARSKNLVSFFVFFLYLLLIVQELCWYDGHQVRCLKYSLRTYQGQDISKSACLHTSSLEPNKRCLFIFTLLVYSNHKITEKKR